MWFFFVVRKKNMMRQNDVNEKVLISKLKYKQQLQNLSVCVSPEPADSILSVAAEPHG